MLVQSLRHDISVRLIAHSPDGQLIVEHFDPNYTTISTEHPVPCEFTDLFTDAQYFRVIYSAGETTDDDPKAPIAPFMRVTVIPNPSNLRSGVAGSYKHVNLTLQYIDFDEAASPALVADLCRHGHSFFFPQLAQYITSNPDLTQARCMRLLRATVFLDYSLMHRAMNQDDEGIVLGLGTCMMAGFTRGILTSDDVVELVAAKHGSREALSIGAGAGHLTAIKAYAKMLLMLFRAEVLSQKQIKRLMLSSGRLDNASLAVQDAYKSALRKLRDNAALTTDQYGDILDRVFG